MSEERLERIENQLGQVLQAIIGVDNRVTDLETRLNARIDGLENRMTGLENRMNERMTNLETRMGDRMTVLEGTLAVMMRGGFNSLRGTVKHNQAPAKIFS
jgi:flagellar capping protein FliD